MAEDFFGFVERKETPKNNPCRMLGPHFELVEAVAKVLTTAN